MSFDVSVYGFDLNSTQATHDQVPPLMWYATLGVQAMRPGCFRIEVLQTANQVLSLPNGNIAFRDYTSSDLYVSDGKFQSWSSKPVHQPVEGKSTLRINRESRYTRKKAGADMIHSDMATALGEGALQWPELLFATDPLRQFHFRLDGKAILKGKPVLAYVSTLFRGKGQERSVTRLKLYLSRETGLPTQLSTLYEDRHGRWVEGGREEYSHWQIDPLLPMSVFDTEPPADAKLIQ